MIDPALLEPWVRLVCAILHRATLDARAGRSNRLRIEARLFLFEPYSEFLMESVNLDVDAVRSKVLSQWLRGVGKNLLT